MLCLLGAGKPRLNSGVLVLAIEEMLVVVLCWSVVEVLRCQAVVRRLQDP